jgi:hypothetical protein
MHHPVSEAAQHTNQQHCRAVATAAWHRACQGSQHCVDARTSRARPAYFQTESKQFWRGPAFSSGYRHTHSFDVKSALFPGCA